MAMRSLKRIKVAIDLTPMRVGGENGGAKTLVLTLLNEFSRRKSDRFEYLIIADECNYNELFELQSENITCLLKSEIFLGKGRRGRRDYSLRSIGICLMNSWDKSRYFVRRFLQKVELELFSLELFCGSFEFVFSKFLFKLIKLIRLLFSFASGLLSQSKVLQEKQGVEILFCPFSSPTFAEKGLPLVAIVYDLQHLDIPEFFNQRERTNRTRFLKALLTQAVKIVCISSFTQQSYINYFKANSQQVLSIPVCIHERLKHQPQPQVIATLDTLGLGGKAYLFFPANFWPHKNHRVLLEAYQSYRDSCPADAVDLVFTGALESGRKEIEKLSEMLGLSNNIHFMGFLAEPELISIWQGCQGLVFPSLYEGFGIPLVEAMWFQKPIACSNVGSLPQVGGDAAVYFDPSKPSEISRAIARIAHDQVLVEELIVRGKRHLQKFSQSAMVEQYLDVFRAVLDNHQGEISSKSSDL